MLSVIVPVYNVANYLESCVLSIINQTYNDIEIILINDGSNDSSKKICESFAKQYDNIIFIDQNNKGVSAARNAGLKIASGNLITFVDSDDTLDYDMYEVLIKFMNDNNLDIAHCSYKRIDESGIKCVGNDTGKEYIQNRVEALDCLITGSLFNGSLWNKIYKKSIIENLCFNEKLKINEDILFNFLAFNNCNRTGFINFSKYNYYVRKGCTATTTTLIQKKFEDSLFVNKYIFDTIKDSCLVNKTANRYAYNLLHYARVSKLSKEDKRSIKIKLKEMQSNYILNSRTSQSINLYCFSSFLFFTFYKIYDKIRTPNWDVIDYE